MPSRAVPSCAEPCCTGPSRAEPSRAEPSYTGPCRTVLSRAVPSRAVPSRAVPSRAVPNRAVPSRAVPSRAPCLLGPGRSSAGTPSFLRSCRALSGLSSLPAFPEASPCSARTLGGFEHRLGSAGSCQRSFTLSGELPYSNFRLTARHGDVFESVADSDIARPPWQCVCSHVRETSPW